MRLVWQGKEMVIYFIIAGTLMCATIGEYALWDDEANTALFAKSVWATGVPSAIVGENIVAFRHGVELTDGVNRFMPPLTYYIAAPFVGLLGNSAIAARLPFYLIGLSGIFLAFRYVRKVAGLSEALIFGLGLFCNVSLLLYIKQARYYAVAVTLSILLAIAYSERKRRRNLTLFSICSCLLLATHYLAYVAALLCVAFDYLVWGRREYAISKKQFISIVFVQLCAVALVVFVMQPFGKSAAPAGDTDYWHGKALLLAWTIRDMNRCEFGLMALLVLGPIAFVLGKADRSILRMASASWIYLLTVCFLSPQPMGTGYPAVADVRYMIAIVPLLVAMTAHMIQSIPSAWMRATVAILVFSTNGFHWCTSRLWGPITFSPQSTAYLYFMEIKNNRTDPYTKTAEWLRANAHPGASVAVFPGHALYPLMGHAPKQLYAWQLHREQRPLYPSLPALHFEDEASPDYFLGFGLGQHEAHSKTDLLFRKFGETYTQVEFIAEHFPESYRPEFYWRIFDRPMTGPEGVDGIVVYKKQPSQI